jgi:hypothetical protein
MDISSGMNPFQFLSDVFQLYNVPIVGGAFENPKEADKQRTMAATTKYVQQQRPEQVQTQMNMLNNQLSAYQPAADVMASLGLPTQGVQYAGVNPYGQSAYGGWTGLGGAPPATDYPGPAAQQQQNYDDLARKSQPNFFGIGGSHPQRQTIPDWYDEAGNRHSVQYVDGKPTERVFDPMTGNMLQQGVGPNAVYYTGGKDPVVDYAGTGNVGANDQGQLDMEKLKP